MNRKLRQSGITLIESIATLGIMSAVAVGTVVMSNQYTADTRATGAAEHMRVVAEATRAYVKDHRVVVMGIATATSPALITPTILASAGYLPPGFSASNIYGQSLCALILEPTAGTLNTLVVAEGGQALDDVTLAHFSSLMGAGGGGRFSSGGTTLQGAGGAWSMPLATFNNRTNNAGQRCTGAAGAVQISIGAPVYAQWMDSSDTADPGFLSRDVVPGNPGANTMQTNINMGGNRITNLNLANAGSACGAGVNNGEISIGSRNEVLACNAGTWQRQGMAYWGANVTNYSNLPACDAANMGETRRVTAISGLFVCSGLRWDAALNESNNFSLPQHLRVAGNTQIIGSSTVFGNSAVSGNASVLGSSTNYGPTTLHGPTTAHSAINANAGLNVGAGQTISSIGALSIEAAGNLHLKPWGAGGQVVIGGSGGTGNLTAAGRITANGSQALTSRSNDWAVMARDSAGGLNNQAKNSAGSMHVNDIYVRSMGGWLSDLAGSSLTMVNPVHILTARNTTSWYTINVSSAPPGTKHVLLTTVAHINSGGGAAYIQARANPAAVTHNVAASRADGGGDAVSNLSQAFAPYDPVTKTFQIRFSGNSDLNWTVHISGYM